MVSQPLLTDQHTGSAIYIETMRDDSFFSNHLADAVHDGVRDDSFFSNHLADAVHDGVRDDSFFSNHLADAVHDLPLRGT